MTNLLPYKYLYLLLKPWRDLLIIARLEKRLLAQLNARRGTYCLTCHPGRSLWMSRLRNNSPSRILCLGVYVGTLAKSSWLLLSSSASDWKRVLHGDSPDKLGLCWSPSLILGCHFMMINPKISYRILNNFMLVDPFNIKAIHKEIQ